MLTLPALGVLNPCNGFVCQFNIKSTVLLNNLERFGMHPIDDDVQVDIVRVGMKAIDGLVVFPPKLIHEDANRFLYLLRAWLFAFAPTQDVVIDGVLAAHGFL